MHVTTNSDLFQDCVPDTSKKPSGGNQFFGDVDTLQNDDFEGVAAVLISDAGTGHNIAQENSKF